MIERPVRTHDIVRGDPVSSPSYAKVHAKLSELGSKFDMEITL